MIDSILIFLNSLPFIVWQFLSGVIGILTYFACVKTQFIPIEDINPVNNFLNIRKPLPIIFFCVVGGMMPVFLGTMTLLGCFLNGFTLRLILVGFCGGIKNDKKRD